MLSGRYSSLLVIILVSTMLLATGYPGTPTGNSRDLPHLIIWSWERDDDLKWLDPHRVAVAYLAGTIVLGKDVAIFKKRFNRLSIPETVERFPVFRIENAHKHNPPMEAAIRSAVDLIVAYTKSARCDRIQIDFDAKETEREAYLNLLQAVKERLPGECAISITALASWCLDDKWLQKAPVNETVAMVFCMGSGKSEALSALKHEHIDSGAPCKQSLGIALCESDTNRQLHELGCLERCDHLYVFSPLGWTKRRYEQLWEEVTHR